MPFLDYKCKNCGKEFSELVKHSDDEVLCPNCKTKAERVYYGQVSGSFGKKSCSCSGNCSTCSGCK